MAVREKTQGGDRQGPGLPTRILDVFEIIPAESNPRKQLKPGSKDFEDLKKSIETFGLVSQLVFNKRSERLIGGHQRLLVDQICRFIDRQQRDQLKKLGAGAKRRKSA